MACLKCGSEWVTLKGKNVVSCPECCKQQRCKARKQGRLPAEQEKTCERCGVAFTAVGGNAIRHSRHCSDCSESARREYLQARGSRIKSGEWRTKLQAKGKDRKCVRCEKKLTHGQQKYCSRQCFFAAREDGSQSWDRTNQNGSSLRRAVANRSSPSSRALSKILNGFSGFMQRLRAFHRIAFRPGCPICGKHHERPVSRFCSDACARQFQFSTFCVRCGCSTDSKGYRGSTRRVCNACEVQASREARRKHRRKYGKNHRDRARHHGVKYVSFPVRYVYERDGYKCQICSKQVFQKARYRKSDGKIHPRSPTIDHIVPMSKGGNHEPDNCQTACFMCNSRKSDSGGGQLRLAIAARPSK
jgi:hypothetical protein